MLTYIRILCLILIYFPVGQLQESFLNIEQCRELLKNDKKEGDLEKYKDFFEKNQIDSEQVCKDQDIENCYMKEKNRLKNRKKRENRKKNKNKIKENPGDSENDPKNSIQDSDNDHELGMTESSDNNNNNHNNDTNNIWIILFSISLVVNIMFVVLKLKQCKLQQMEYSQIQMGNNTVEFQPINTPVDSISDELHQQQLSTKQKLPNTYSSDEDKLKEMLIEFTEKELQYLLEKKREIKLNNKKKAKI